VIHVGGDNSELLVFCCFFEFLFAVLFGGFNDSPLGVLGFFSVRGVVTGKWEIVLFLEVCPVGLCDGERVFDKVDFVFLVIRKCLSEGEDVCGCG